MQNLSLTKLIIILGIFQLICFVSIGIHYKNEEKTAISNIMNPYIEANKNQILNKESNDNLACNKNECIANYNSLVSAGLIKTEDDKKVFKEGQYYIFSTENNKIHFRVVKSNSEIKDEQDALMLSTALRIATN